MLQRHQNVELTQLLTNAAAILAAIEGPIWSSYKTGSDMATAVLGCLDGLRRDAITSSQLQTLTNIFAPTCDWDDVGGDSALGNQIFALLEDLAASPLAEEN